MSRRYFTVAGVLATAALSLTSVPAAGQAPTKAAKAYTPPRTGDGQPDLQGVWDFRNVIPLERPSQFAGKAFLTDEEVAAFEKSASARLDMDRRDDEPGRTPAVVNGAVRVLMNGAPGAMESAPRG